MADPRMNHLRGLLLALRRALDVVLAAWPEGEVEALREPEGDPEVGEVPPAVWYVVWHLPEVEPGYGPGVYEGSGAWNRILAQCGGRYEGSDAALCRANSLAEPHQRLEEERPLSTH